MSYTLNIQCADETIHKVTGLSLEERMREEDFWFDNRHARLIIARREDTGKIVCVRSRER